ncbi:hypothetical protein E2C01_022031 [Portunus trituberculatus]|uniref:Uncharacterized protein n=1 Tax=Portunus trituberculatus TaxID=210409 RepID=A0A5B7E4C4_PORTR|nr:hypothetical protein [Portunus trituberculatus]
MDHWVPEDECHVVTLGSGDRQCGEGDPSILIHAMHHGPGVEAGHPLCPPRGSLSLSCFSEAEASFVFLEVFFFPSLSLSSFSSLDFALPSVLDSELRRHFGENFFPFSAGDTLALCEADLLLSGEAVFFALTKSCFFSDTALVLRLPPAFSAIFESLEVPASPFCAALAPFPFTLALSAPLFGDLPQDLRAGDLPVTLLGALLGDRLLELEDLLREETPDEDFGEDSLQEEEEERLVGVRPSLVLRRVLGFTTLSFLVVWKGVE